MMFLNRKIEPNPLTLQATLDYSLANFAGRPCVSFVDGKPLTYAQFGEKIQVLSAMLYSLGLKKGDRIALLSHNMPNWVISYFTVVSNGFIVVPILPDFSRDEVESVLTHSEAKALFISERLYNRIEGLELPCLSSVIMTDSLTLKKGGISPEVSVAEYERPVVEENDLAAIIYTSGTTGRSKGVMLTHKNLTWSATQSFTMQEIHSSDTFLSFLPLSHTYENTIGMIYPLMYGASVYYLEKPPTAAALLPAMAKIKPTLMLSVPLIMEKLYKNQVQSKFMKTEFTRFVYKNPLFRVIIHRIAGKKLKASFGGNLKFFGIGGAKLDSRVERFLKEAKFPYAIGYGLTETSPLLAGTKVKETLLQSTGFALQGVELRINNPDKRGVGEIWAKGPNVMKGYYKNPEATDEVLTGDGWFKTGDLGRFGPRKRLFIKGRMKNTIVGASGENIYPEDIESVIDNAQHVIESLVVEEGGFLVAKVLFDLESLEKNLENLKLNIDDRKERMQQWMQNFTRELNGKLNRVSQIKRVDVMDEPFEKTASQKIKRFLYTKPQEIMNKRKKKTAEKK
ncbi:MAG: AMP-binding protein [Prevotellaceae bacterium]|jgi:long-chain acyl-CoA synthetase|nr:AMP-binding protein [Prevotellaceae bacterium]